MIRRRLVTVKTGPEVLDISLRVVRVARLVLRIADHHKAVVVNVTLTAGKLAGRRIRITDWAGVRISIKPRISMAVCTLT